MSPIYTVLLVLPGLALSQTFKPNKKDDFESNFDCHSERCISFQFLNNRKPPTIKTANSFITAITYPFELQLCDWGADNVYNVWAIFPDGSTQQLTPHKKAEYPFRKIKVTVKPDLSKPKSSKNKDEVEVDLYNLPRTNLQCQDLSGIDFDIFLVTDVRPHNQVQLGIKNKYINKNNILKLSKALEDEKKEISPRVIDPMKQKKEPKDKVHYTKRHEGNLGKSIILKYHTKIEGHRGT